ncbi:MAG TPA: peroxiredoxin [Terriglobales bacterium]|jgi:peroxiredoxin Q/BCP|nr:peroxiredoxin [Terriglobales bacterium]
MLSAGNPFPSFSLSNQDGKNTKLSDFAGSWLVIYFYPKDDTPGCTIQAKSFTATKADFDAAGIKVIGISADDAASHKNFCNKYSLTVEFLADTDGSLMKTLGLGQAEWKGMKFWERTSFVVDPHGTIRKVYEKVNPEGHEKVLLADIAALKAKAA